MFQMREAKPRLGFSYGEKSVNKSQIRPCLPVSGSAAPFKILLGSDEQIRPMEIPKGVGISGRTCLCSKTSVASSVLQGADGIHFNHSCKSRSEPRSWLFAPRHKQLLCKQDWYLLIPPSQTKEEWPKVLGASVPVRRNQENLDPSLLLPGHG